jgi:hypothetical protein
MNGMNAADRVQLELLRKMTPAEKLECVRGLTLAVQQLAFVGLRQQFPDDSDDEIWLRLAARRLGRDLVKKIYGWEAD